MEPPYKEAVNWLFSELLKECLQSHSFSLVEEFIPIVDDFEREELLKFIFWKALTSREWWLAEHCLANGVCMAPSEASDDGPLHAAMYFCGDSPDVIAWLLAHGAELERRGPSNTTPLIHATADGLNGIVELLLQRGANVNASTMIDDDQTALMVAARTGNERATKSLIAHGAKIAPKDRWGRDAATLAELGGHSELDMLLRTRENFRNTLTP